jgi:hypothetical protein
MNKPTTKSGVNVFNRRSGAIAAAIALTLEAPEVIDQ